MFELLYPLVRAIEPFLVPICCCLAWVLMLLVGWSIWSAIASGVANAKLMHQIPCPYCVFFTNEPCLKCPVRPTAAMTEDAIGCPDYRERSRYGN